MSQLSWIQSIQASPGPGTIKEYLVLFLKALLMGMADLIPGVSGGTVAFVTGIYEDLLNAISSIDKRALKKVLSFELKELVQTVHLRFLVTLFSGILLAIFSLATLMHYFMTTHPILTWSVFLGLIAASTVVIFRQLDNPLRWKNILSLTVGTILAYVIVSLIPVSTPEHLSFIFLCGIISISAMILPGLSGSFLLLILGKYEYITGAVKSPFVEGNFLILITFALGSVAGALGFTKILSWFLKHYRSETMAALTGILLGSMKKLWPWKITLETKFVGGKERILREANILPDLSSETYLAFFLMLIGFVFVLLLESRSKKS